jgi:hypothetical protein
MKLNLSSNQSINLLIKRFICILTFPFPDTPDYSVSVLGCQEGYENQCFCPS